MRGLEEKSRFFKALGEPIRLKIIGFLLGKRECTCICELSSFLIRDQSVIFRHVQILKDAGILNTKKESRCLMCCVKDKESIKKMLEV
ncbi:ArsR family transcriptional regulator [Candidatus Woesearchaeota archaeon]|nr:ArsR family transcriptional regulator [Candidatus Woesearchaeota archaeon]